MKQKTTYHSFARYGTFLLAVTTLLSSLSYGDSHTISVDKPDTTFVFGNPKSGQMTIFPWGQNDNRMTFCTQKGSDPELNLYNTNDCMNVLSDGKMESLYMSLASQVSKKQWYKNSPCSNNHNKKSVTYSVLVDCYRWLAKNKITTGNDEQVSKVVEKPIQSNEVEANSGPDFTRL